MRLWRTAPGKSDGGRALAAIPVLVALFLGYVLLPRSVPPRDIPLPVPDAAALAEIEASDAARVRAAKDTPLPIEVRALGEAIRAFASAEAAAAPDTPWEVLRANIDRTRKEALPFGRGPLFTLRATQSARFLEELHAWERGAEPSPELAATGGGFLRRFAQVGWVEGRNVALDDEALRVAYKQWWNGIAGFEGLEDFAPTLDEQRVLFAFYLTHPHAPERTKASIDAARATAKTPQDCAALDSGEQMAEESWRAEKIRALGKIDPAYPTDYALGVAEYRAGRFEASAQAFEAWLKVHPNGPLTLRARNHLRAALASP